MLKYFHVFLKDEAKDDKVEEESAEATEATEAVQEDKVEGEEVSDESEKKTPTPYQELDIKSLRVLELRQELDARGLNTTGLKKDLVDRLQKAVQEEQEKEENGGCEAAEAGAEEEATEETPMEAVSKISSKFYENFSVKIFRHKRQIQSENKF